MKKISVVMVLLGLFAAYGVARQDFENIRAIDGTLLMETDVQLSVNDNSIIVSPATSKGAKLVLDAVGAYNFVVTNQGTSRQIVKLVRVVNPSMLLDHNTSKLARSLIGGNGSTSSLTLIPEETGTIKFVASTDKTGTWAITNGTALRLFFVN